MKKLDDIPKKDFFSVPDGYFDKLPGVIQSRVMERKSEKFHLTAGVVLRYALPAVVLISLGIFWFNQSAVPVDAETLLASVETEDLIMYLDESDITIDELLGTYDFTVNEIDDIESDVYTFQMDSEGIESDIDDLIY